MRHHLFFPLLAAFLVFFSIGGLRADEARPDSSESSTRRGDADADDQRITAESRISAVTVYNDRAEITRTAEIDLPAGSRIVAFKDLPGNLVPDSLRAEGTAGGKVTIGAVSQKEFVEKQLARPGERDEAETIRKLQAEVAGIEAEKTALTARKAMQEKLEAQAGAQFARDFGETNYKPEQWVAAADALHASSAEIMTALARDDVRERDLNADIVREQNKLGQVATGERSTHGVTIPVETEKPAKLTISLKYQVPNAGWRPVYEARLDTKAEKDGVSLAQYGVVWQRTGEDWKGVALTLSTAQPQREATLPVLQPRWIDLQEKPKTETRDLSSEEYQQRLIENTTGPGAAIPVKDPSVTASASGFVNEYKIDQPSDVPADGTNAKLLMGRFESESRLLDYVRPQLGTEAFLVSRIKLKGDVSLLPGNVDLFRDEAFVGQTPMPLLRPGEDSDLYFGVDDALVVTHQTLKNARKEAGVLDQNNILERAYVTDLQNFHKTPIEVVLREAVPVSRDEKLKVDFAGEGQTTPGFKEDSEHVKGQLAWRFPLQPHEKKSIRLSWNLNWPSGYLFQGLPN